PNDIPIPGVVLMLGDADGKPVLDANGNPITAVTDSEGYYQFTNLVPGTYSVFELQPAGYDDGVDTPGTTGGVAANRSNLFSPVLINVDHRNDAIVRIVVEAGVVSQENNFSEVQFSSPPPIIPPPDPRTPPPPLEPNTPASVLLQPRIVPFSP